MTPCHHEFGTVFSWIPIMLLMVLGGCRGCGGKTGPVQHSDKKGPLDCHVTVYAPVYGSSDTRPSVEVYWDAREVFSGRIPSGGSGPPMPLTLIEITTSHGSHVLEVRSGDSHQKQDIKLREKEDRHYKILGGEGGKGLLIEDLGPNPMFL